jgi:hypothetical protein
LTDSGAWCRKRSDCSRVCKSASTRERGKTADLDHIKWRGNYSTGHSSNTTTSAQLAKGTRGTHLPAAECFHPDKDFFCDGDDVDGGTSDDGDAAGTLVVEEEATELDDDPGSQADENEIG